MELLKPFAVTGEKEDFSVDTDPEGKVSLEKGFTTLYELKPTEGGLYILRKIFNQMMYLVTSDTVKWKNQAFPDYYSGLTYPKNAVVRYTNGNVYVSKVANNATIPTNATNWLLFNPSNGYVELVGNQTIAGVKTFSSSPIVPVPTTDFQSVPFKSTNITVNVGAGQTYTTINQALEYLSGFYPMYKKNGITATINLKARFVMAEQVLVSGIDLGWITIVGEDAETTITHTALTTAFYNNYPAFGVDKGGTSPIIGQLFRFNVEKVGENKHGLMTWGAGSSANILSDCGFIGAGTNGIFASNNSAVNANGANASNAGTNGIFANGASIINAFGVIIQNQTTGTARIRVGDGSTIEATGINTNGGTVPALSQTANTLTGNGIIYQ